MTSNGCLMLEISLKQKYYKNKYWGTYLDTEFNQSYFLYDIFFPEMANLGHKIPNI